jgi:hypothetical protein
MEPEPGNLKPRGPQDGRGTGEEVAPVGRRKRPVLEVGSEKMKVNDPENCQALRDIEPEKSFHLRPALAAGGESRKEEVRMMN